MKIKLILAATLVAMPLVSGAVTLEDTVKEVLATNPQVQERIKYFRSVKQDVGIAEANYYPKVDVVAGVGRERTNKASTSYEDVYLDREEAGVIISQNIFEGFGTQSNVARQHARVESAAFSVIETANQTSLEMVEAYTDLFKEKELLALAEVNVETHKKINEKIQERIDSGVGASSELEQSSSRLALAESNYLVQMNNYDDALSAFIKVYGKYVAPEDLVEPTGVLNLPATKDVAMVWSKDTNPSLKVQRANIKVTKSNYNIANKEFYPTIDLVARQDWNRNISGVEGQDDSASVMLRFRYNLYNGNADTSAKQKRVSEMHQEMQVYEDLVRRVDESIRLAWMAYKTLDKQMGYLENHKALSEKTLASYVEEFDLGRRTLLDILDTEEELYSANRELATAKYDSIFAQYRIVESIGSITMLMDDNFANVVGLGEESASMADALDMMPAEEK